ncbi:MAG: T9SS type A sorting domain-containing protein [Saprospiraceae bacterium]
MMIPLICLVFLYPVSSQIIFEDIKSSEKNNEEIVAQNLLKNEPSELNTLYVSSADDIIECPADQQALFDFSNLYGYNHLILYGIKNYINGLPKEQVDNLGNFIEAAHANKITISINVGSYAGSVDIRNYWNQQEDASKKYDALHLEKEYWNGTGSSCENQQAAFEEYIIELKNIYNFCHENVNGISARNIICETYLGNPCHRNERPTREGQEQINLIVQKTDRVYLAYYKQDPFSPSLGIFHSKLYRLDYFANAEDEAGKPVNTEVSILFNAYQDNPNESDDMFDWLNEMADNGTPYDELFALPFHYWMNGENGFIPNRDNNVNNLKFPKSSELKNINILGHGWYKYQSLQEVIGNTVGNCQPPQLLSAGQNNNNFLQPNPANQEIILTLPGHPENGNYLMYDLNGRIISMGNLTEKINKINTNDVPNGMYIIKARKNKSENYLVEKIMVQH